MLDLAPHLTNTSLQIDRGDAGVRLLQELVGSSILSTHNEGVLSESDIEDITNQTAHILAEGFRAALASPVHFQVGHHLHYDLSVPPLIICAVAPPKCVRAIWGGPTRDTFTIQDR
jgi:hypothetical protein